MRRFMLALVVLLWGTTGFAQAPKATLEQARNGTASSPTSPVVFQTGNLGSSNSHYVEGMSAPYRLVLENISLGAHNVIIEWDIKNGGAHAIDYITHYDRLQPHNFSPPHAQEVVNPLNGLTGPFGGPSTFAIPAPSSAGSPVAGQPTADFNALPAGERNMTIWNGSISSLSYVNQGSLTAAQSASSISIDFTATSSTVVIAWGGHLASRLVWGDGNSAGGISGSPFHMRLLEFDGSGGNQDRSMQAAAVAPTPLADLSLVKSVSNPTPLVGSTVTFTIAVTNSGPDAATNVSVADVIPSGYTYVAGSIAGGTSRSAAGAPTLTWTIASLANGATTNLSFQAVVNATGNYLNVAQVTASDQEDPDSTPNNENGAPYEDDEDDATVVPTPVADLSLLKSVNNPTANVGSTVTFTIAVTNNGPSTATNVSVGDVIPSGFTYVTGSIAGGTSRSAAGAPTLTWTIASLANGASTNLTFQAVVNATGSYTNVAQVTASDQYDPDSTPNNENGTPYEDDEDDATVVPTAVADLSLLKSVDNPTANVGSTVTFTIAVTNNGPSTATNVSVGDVIPSGFTYVTGSIAGGTSRSDASAPTLAWTIASLANGASTNLTFQAVVNATGNYTNVAQVTASDQPDPDSAPNNENGAPYEDDEDDATVSPSAVSDLSLVKTVNNPTANVGSTVTFTIAVTNNGPSTATNVSVGDVIPSGFTYVTGSIAGGTSRSAAGAPTLTWTIASLANGASTNLTFQAVVNATGSYTNVAQVTASDQPDPDSAPNNENGAPYEDDEDDATVSPSAVSDLSLVKTVNNPTANVGSTVTFTIAVTNNGPSTATNVSVGDVIPSGFTYVTGSIAGGTSRSAAGAPTLTWTIASLANGASTNLTFQAVVNATGNYTNVAQVTASDQNDPDSTPNNENGTPYEDDEDDATVVPTAVADLSLLKTVNNPTANVGSTVTFTIAVTNNGPSTATNVSVGDVIPSGFTYVTGSIAGGTSRTAAAPNLSWTIASLANGASTNLTFQAVVNATGNYTNVAQVTASDQNDPDSAPNNENGAPYEDDEDDATVSPSAVSDLSLVKTVNNPTANVGSTVTFTIAVTNNGPSTATNVSVGDVIPSGFTYVTGSIAGGTSRTAAAPNLSWTIASLANGVTTNLTYQAVVNATGNYTNVAQVTASDQPDPDSAPNNENGAPYEDDEDDATVTPQAVADLSLQKSVNNPTATVGSTVTFTIAVTNNGPSTATNVSVGDVIPSGFTYVTGSIAGGTSRTAAAPNLSWTIASLANGASTNLTFQAVVNATGSYTNVAQVTASDQPDPDSAPNNENGAPYEDDEDDATVTPSSGCENSYLYVISDEDYNQLSRVKLDGQSSTLTVVANQIIYDGPMPGTPLLSGFTVGKPIGDDTESATFHPTPGKAFIISNLKTVSALFVLDLHTGRAKSVGYTRTSLGVGVDDINGLAYNRNDGYLYGVTVNGDRLVKINPSNARVVKLYSSAIASSGNPDFEGLEFDYSVSPPVLYAISEYGSGQIYRVNLTTGVGTQVGSTMLGMESIAFSEQDGTIYASNNNGGLYVLDRTTFAATKYANTLVIDGEGIVLEECVDQLVKGAAQEGGLATTAAVPENYALQQNYPNPFNPTTLIHFDLPEAGQVKLTVYDAMGRLVRTLVSEHRPAGSYEILWDATDEHGTRVASGVYLYRLEVNDFTAVRRMLMLK